MNPNDLYAHLDIEKDLVTGFSIMFSRLEYALKRSSSYALEKRNGVEANWKQFAIDHEEGFNRKKT